MKFSLKVGESVYNILVVEDEPNISQITCMYLERDGYQVSLAKNGFEALELFSKNSFHLILLDVMMPGIDGFEVLKRIRETSDVPVIMVTAKQEEVDRIKGFDNGVDDYVVKPFSPRELMSRIKVILRRIYNGSEEIVYQVGSLKLYTGSMKLMRNNTIIELTTTEYDLLLTFMRHEGQILSREQLIRLSFGNMYEGFDRNVDSYIKRIRQKIEDDPKNPKLLRTKYGRGYVFGGELL